MSATIRIQDDVTREQCRKLTRIVAGDRKDKFVDKRPMLFFRDQMARAFRIWLTSDMLSAYAIAAMTSLLG